MADVSHTKQVLSQQPDDISREFGLKTYTKMANDPIVRAGIDYLLSAVLANGVLIRPRIEIQPGEESSPDDDAKAKRAQELSEFVTRNFDNLAMDGEPILAICEQLLRGRIVFGHKVCEKLYAWGSGVDRGRYVLKSIKPKATEACAFAVDPYMNVLGISAAIPEEFMIPEVGAAENVEVLPTFLPRDRFVVLSGGSPDGDPRGEPMLRPAYNPFYIKSKILPEYFRYLKKFASPSIVGKTSSIGVDEVQRNADGSIKTDDQGRELVASEADRMREAILAFENGSYIIVPNDAEVDLKASEGDGKAFIDAIDWLDRQILTAILGTHRTSMESSRSSQADSRQAQDVAGLKVAYLRKSLETCLYRDVILPLIRINFGDDAIELAPIVSLSEIEQQDRAALIQAFSSAYGSGLISDDQLPGIDAMLGLPKRDMDAMAQAKEENSIIRKLAAGDTGKSLNPSADDAVEE